jgi:hypothetical protein
MRAIDRRLHRLGETFAPRENEEVKPGIYQLLRFLRIGRWRVAMPNEQATR